MIKTYNILNWIYFGVAVMIPVDKLNKGEGELVISFIIGSCTILWLWVIIDLNRWTIELILFLILGVIGTIYFLLCSYYKEEMIFQILPQRGLAFRSPSDNSTTQKDSGNPAIRNEEFK